MSEASTELRPEQRGPTVAQRLGGAAKELLQEVGREQTLRGGFDSVQERSVFQEFAFDVIRFNQCFGSIDVICYNRMQSEFQPGEILDQRGDLGGSSLVLPGEPSKENRTDCPVRRVTVRKMLPHRHRRDVLLKRIVSRFRPRYRKSTKDYLNLWSFSNYIFNTIT